MSAWWQFRALIRKNIQTLKRTMFSTFMEIFFPGILMLICYLVKLVFHSTTTEWEDEDGLEEYLIDKGNLGLDYEIYRNVTEKFYSNNAYSYEHGTDAVGIETKDFGEAESKIWKYEDDSDKTNYIPVLTLGGLPLKYLTIQCYDRDTIAFIGFDIDSPLALKIRNYIGVEEQILGRKYKYKKYETIDELNDYVKSDDFGKDNNPLICFGIHFDDSGKNDHKYKASLHYFNDRITNGFEDIPNNLEPYRDEMQKGPNMNDVQKYSDHGYIQIMNIISNYMLKETTGSNESYINFGFALQKYDSYKFNDFSDFAGVYFTFFAILSYLCPLILYVLKGPRCP